MNSGGGQRTTHFHLVWSNPRLPTDWPTMSPCLIKQRISWCRQFRWSPKSFLIWPSDPAFASYHASHHLHSLVARSSRVPSGHAHAVLVLQNLLRLKTISREKIDMTILWIELPGWRCPSLECLVLSLQVNLMPNDPAKCRSNILYEVLWSKPAFNGAYIVELNIIKPHLPFLPYPSYFMVSFHL